MSPIGFAKAIITTASGAGGGNGSSAGNPAISAKEAYNGGLRGSTAWVSIPGNGSFQFQYDDSDRYGTNEYGWINYDRWFFGNNYSQIDWLRYGSPSSIIPAWTEDNNTDSHTSIGTGRFRIGREQSHQGGNSLSTIRYRLPAHTSMRWWMQAHTYGSDLSLIHI